MILHKTLNIAGSRSSDPARDGIIGRHNQMLKPEWSPSTDIHVLGRGLNIAGNINGRGKVSKYLVR